MKVIEVIKGSPIGYYTISLACCGCGKQLTESYYGIGLFNEHNEKGLFYASKYCPLCGHKFKQERRMFGFDIRKLCGLSKEECTDEALVKALKQFGYLPSGFNQKPVFKRSFRGDDTGGIWEDVWFLGSPESM